MVTLLATAIVGMVIALVSVMVLGVRGLHSSFKLTLVMGGYLGFLTWLLTLGNPTSSTSLHAMYLKHTRLQAGAQEQTRKAPPVNQGEVVKRKP
jgi:hypothetical protein